MTTTWTTVLNGAATTVGVAAADLLARANHTGAQLVTTISNLEAGTITATGGTTARSLSDRAGDAVNVKDFGAVGDGVTDDTAALKTAFEYGGRILVPAGTYLVDTPTVLGVPVPGTGGVACTITKSLEVVCDPRATFTGNAARRLDGSLIRLDAGTGTSGLSIHWYGGVINLEQIKGSTSMPATGVWPPVDQGIRAITDGLDIRGDYTASLGVNAAGYRNVIVDGVRFISGTHWLTAGGDSSLFISGAEQLVIRNCYFLAARDAAIYISADSIGNSTAADAIIDGNTFVNCIQGFASKRQVMRNVVTNNTFKNTGMAVLILPADGVPSSDRSVVANNVFEQVSIGVRLDGTDNTLVANNIYFNGGSVMADGTKPASYLTSPDFCRIEGSSRTLVTGNVVYGGDPTYAADLPDGVFISDGTINASSSHTIITNNVFDGIRHPIFENASAEAISSRFYNNQIRSCQYTRLENTNSAAMEYTSDGRGLLLTHRQGGVVGLYFGDAASGTAGAITYDHAADEFSLRSGDAVRWRVESGGTLRPNVDITPDIGTTTRRVRAAYIRDLHPGAGTVIWTSGTGTPEGVVTAAIGSLFTRTDGGASTTLYCKESGSGNTGWAAK